MIASVGVAGCLGGDDGEGDGNGSRAGGNATNATNDTTDGNATSGGNATDGGNATTDAGTENETGNATGNESSGNRTGNESENATGSGGDAPAAVVAVAPNNQMRFDPESVEIRAGETVVWRWKDDGHNVKPTAQPDGADWSGTPGDGSTLYDTGFEYAHTFDVPGEYEYVCVPHKSMGMRGSLTVR